MSRVSDNVRLIAVERGIPRREDGRSGRPGGNDLEARHRTSDKGNVERSGMGVRMARFPETIICLGVLVAGGCAQSGSSGHSKLAGRWYAAESGTRVRMGSDGITTEVSPTPTREAALMIRDDGSFDLSNTIYGGVEGFERLRRKGDRVYYTESTQPSEYFQVESWTSSPTRSELIIGQYCGDAAQNIKTILSAELVAPGRLLFILGSYGPGATAAVETAVLRK